MMMTTIARAALVLLLAAPAAAETLTLLTKGKTVSFRAAGRKPASGVLRVALDGRALPPRDPRCPATSSLQLSYAEPPDGFVDRGVVELPCDGWTARKKGYRFSSPAAEAAGIRSIVYGPKKLIVKWGGEGFPGVPGPVGYVTVNLVIGDERFMLRIHDFKRNEAGKVVARRPSKVGAQAEAAFFDTVWGDDPRPTETMELLEKAVQKRKDGRSEFLLGMYHLYRASDENDPDPFSVARVAEADAAQPHLDRAVELLPTDSRIAGFRAAVTWVRGISHMDPALTQLGKDQVDAAIEQNRLFNSFDIFAVAPVIPDPPTSPFFQETVLGLIDFVLVDSAGCLETWPEVCGNRGFAPHNLEATLWLFSDLLLKGGRVDDARRWYNIARSFAVQNEYEYLDVLDERLATIDARAALYQDDDPTNDPELMNGGVGFCKPCHAK